MTSFSKALLITGPVASGKTRKALEIASAMSIFLSGYNHFKETTISHLTGSRFSFADVFLPNPPVVVIDEFLFTRQNFKVLQRIITSEVILVEKKMVSEPVEIKPPPLIIVSTSDRPLPKDDEFAGLFTMLHLGF